MRSSLPRPGLHAVSGGVHSLPRGALQEFLQAVLARGASFRFGARGYSMHPFIKDGETITVCPVGEGRWRSGDVAAFCHPETGRLTVHRIVKKNARGCLLRGDNCDEADGLIPAARLLGRVTQVGGKNRRVRLGLGPERFFLALLSRYHLLQPLLNRIRQVLGPVIRKKFRLSQSTTGLGGRRF